MNLSVIWLVIGATAAIALNSLALTSDYLGLVLPQLSFALSMLILIVGTGVAGLGFLRAMVVPVAVGVLFLLHQPLPGMGVMPLVFGCWFGLANRLLAHPVSLLAFSGQLAVIVSADLLFWRHLGNGPLWGVAGMACYAALSHRPSGRRVLA